MKDINIEIKAPKHPKANSVESSRLYGSFLIGDIEFALPVSSVAEVVNRPEQLVRVPLSPAYFIGVFNLRGTIIPVLDLKVIFQITNTVSDSVGGKVAIVEHDGHKVGLLFDQTNQIIRDTNVELSEFKGTGDSTQLAEEFTDVVSGVLKIDGGKRLIQLLSPHSIIRLDHLHVHGKSVEQTRDHRANLVVRSQKCISFEVANSTLAFNIAEISEIIQPPVIHPTAVSTDSCVGIINLRGGIVPVLDFGHLLKYRNKQDRNHLQTEQKILILNIKNNRVGFLVDRIESIISYHENDILPIPTVENERPKMYRGCLSIAASSASSEKSTNVIFLSADQVLTDNEIQLVTRLHNELYKSKSEGKQNTNTTSAKGSRKSYISFRIEGLFCLEMDDVRELIEFPDELIQPPGLPKYVSGMLNLRGKLVTIIDTRTLYGLQMPRETDGKLPRNKVILFNKNGKDFGLVVDSVESILNPVEYNVLEIPKGDSSDPQNVFSSDSKFIMSLKIQEKTENLVVLNLSSIVERTGFAKAG